MGSGSQRYVAFQKETVAGTLPSPFNAQKLRVTPGSAIENSRTNITSDEIRDDRQIIVSRLGQNAPQFTLPAEVSFESYEDFMAGALGSEWIANYDLKNLTVDVSAGSTILTGDSSAWASKGIATGDYIIISGLTVSAEDGIYYVYSAVTDTMTLYEADGVTPATFTLEADASLRLVGARDGGSVDSSTNNITISSTNKTITAASATWVTDFSIGVGDRVYFAGFTNPSNNGYHKVTAVTDLILTFSASTFVNETLSAGDLEVANATAIVKCGVDLPSFTIEEGFNDVGEYHYTNGAKIETWNASIQTDSIITTEFGFQGVTYSGFSSVASSDTLEDGNVNDVFDTYTGSLTVPGVEDCVITGFDFTLDNGLNPRYALLQKNRCSIGEGRINVTGTINAYFPSSVLSKIYNDELDLSASLYFEDLDTNGYTFGFPKIRFNSDSIDVAENDVTESIGFQALGGEALTTMYVVKQPKIS